jgi:hypothetical protein
MDNRPLGVIWQVTVTKVYRRLTWRLVIGGEIRQRGLLMSEGSYGTDNPD